ncbi:MAG: MBL fold hydrolase [Ignavibacteria bacterium GWF2_33_9]|nr:MAG: MBL fold hydrolase [Ignavibacteria bacterium GWF2_33_9]
MIIDISPSVKWVGKMDYNLRGFHGDQISTHHGSSYNSYLIQDEKTVLVDLVYAPYATDFISNLETIIDLNSIDHIVVNHSEPDHSGALPYLMERIPNTPIICTASGAKAIKGQYHKDWNFQIVKTGDKISLGKNELLFIDAAMLHWPDTMMCYLNNENVLFSNDIFGHHFAATSIFDYDSRKSEIMDEAEKYYASIIFPFANKAKKKMQQLDEMNLPLDFICPAHGVVWKEYIPEILEKYRLWSDAYQLNQVTIFYDSMYGATIKIAETIAEEMKELEPELDVKIYHAGKTDSSDIMTNVFRSKGILVGSSVINNGILNTIAGLLEEICNMGPENKKAAAFGSYGWSPKPIDMMNEHLGSGGFEIAAAPFKVQWMPNAEMLTKAKEFAKIYLESFK